MLRSLLFVLGCHGLPQPSPAEAHAAPAPNSLPLESRVDELVFAEHVEKAILSGIVQQLRVGVAVATVPATGPLTDEMIFLGGNRRSADMFGETIVSGVGLPIGQVFPGLDSEDGERFLLLARDALVRGSSIYVGPIVYEDQEQSRVFDVTIHPVAPGLVAYEFFPGEMTALDSGLLLSEDTYLRLRLETADLLSQRVQSILVQ